MHQTNEVFIPKAQCLLTKSTVSTDEQFTELQPVLLPIICCIIARVEYQGLAEQLLTAFQEANLAPGPTTTAYSSNAQHSFSNSSSSGPEQQQQQQQPERQYEHLGASVLGLNVGAIAGLRRRRRVRSRGSSPSSSSSSSSPTESIDSLESLQQHDRSAKPPEASSSNGETDATPAAAAAAAAASVEEEEVEAAAAADALFTQLLLLLAMRAGFVPLCERDVQLSISLNTGEYCCKPTSATT